MRQIALWFVVAATALGYADVAGYAQASPRFRFGVQTGLVSPQLTGLLLTSSSRPEDWAFLVQAAAEYGRDSGLMLRLAAGVALVGSSSWVQFDTTALYGSAFGRAAAYAGLGSSLILLPSAGSGGIHVALHGALGLKGFPFPELVVYGELRPAGLLRLGAGSSSALVVYWQVNQGLVVRF